MKKALIREILKSVGKNGCAHSRWQYMEGFGGYLVRKDGAFVAVGDDGAQAKKKEAYGALADLKARELAKIYAHMVKKTDIFEEIKTAPMEYGFSNVPKMVKWIEKDLGKKSKSKSKKR